MKQIMNKMLWSVMLVFSAHSTCIAQNSSNELNDTNFVELVSIRTYKSIKKIQLKPEAFIAPALFMGYGVLAVRNIGTLNQLDISTRAELKEDHPKFAAHIDNYAQFSPAVAVFGLNMIGINGKHNLLDASMIYSTSVGITTLSTQLVKQKQHRLRPDGSAYNSFPSGHTATAFAAAEFLRQEYKDISPWYGYAGYFVATATGSLRMYNNRHWFSDVVAGAGFGMASTKLSYLIYSYIKRKIPVKKGAGLSFSPYFQNESKGFVIHKQF